MHKHAPDTRMSFAAHLSVSPRLSSCGSDDDDDDDDEGAICVIDKPPAAT